VILLHQHRFANEEEEDGWVLRMQMRLQWGLLSTALH
jgi:hypothetical protein